MKRDDHVELFFYYGSEELSILPHSATLCERKLDCRSSLCEFNDESWLFYPLPRQDGHDRAV